MASWSPVSSSPRFGRPVNPSCNAWYASAVVACFRSAIFVDDGVDQPPITALDQTQMDFDVSRFTGGQDVALLQGMMIHCANALQSLEPLLRGEPTELAAIHAQHGVPRIAIKRQ